MDSWISEITGDSSVFKGCEALLSFTTCLALVHLFIHSFDILKDCIPAGLHRYRTVCPSKVKIEMSDRLQSD